MWFSLLAALIFAPADITYSRSVEPWGSKPVLAHFLLDPDRAAELQQDLNLSAQQMEALLKVARQEVEQINFLEANSLAVIADPTRSREEKNRWVADSGYNRQIQTILESNHTHLKESLGRADYHRLVVWIKSQWTQERMQFTAQPGARKGLGKLSANAAQAYPRSFEVYATRYDAGDRKIIALPDKCLKFANGSALRCDGYEYGQNYSVAISYEGNLVVASVGESGPWNVDDNYWSKASDPQPRRMFADLPLGLPEAQAAYFNDYNGGLDQFGRLVTSPVAIDISRALAADLGLGAGNNKVTGSFLWTEGWDGSQDRQNSQQGQATALPAAPITWQTVTPNPDGSVIHIVQTGQTLVGIAAIYQIPISELLAQNHLTMQAIIQPGDPILVKPADPTATSAPASTPTHRPPATRTATPAPSKTPSPTLLASPDPPAEEIKAARPDPFLVGLLLAGLTSLALVAWGVSLRRK